MSKKVSIIIPVYNGEEYMREAIDSALAQTYENIEIIVINDGSRDNTDKIAKSYGDKITYYAKENGGVSTALNLGIEKMTGDYFSWLSHDDRYYPEKVEKEINYLEEHGLLDSNTILYSDYDLMDEKSHVYAGSVKDHQLLTEKPDYCILHGDINGLSLLIPKKAFADCGGFRTDLRCVQDYVLWEEMRKAGYNFIHIPEILVTTRIHSMQQGNTSPVMVSEGNDFWINLINDTSEERMIRLEGSRYGFYKKMHDIMATTPYDKAEEFTRKECEKIIAEIKTRINDIKVTVVIPFYNHIDVLINAINSVYAQTHKNTELLLVNDASTDDLSKLREYINNKPIKTRIIDIDTNHGPAYARNIGIENADGEYIAFLDSDDLFVENKLEHQLLEMLASQSLFSHTNYIRNDLSTNEKTTINTSIINGDGLPTIINNMCIASPTIMFKTSFLLENDLKYKTDLRIGEDVCFYMECLKKTNVLAIPEPLSIVNTAAASHAYNREKQLIGLKTIINYVTGDDRFADYHYNLGILLKQFIDVYDSGDVWPKIYYEPPKKASILRRTLHALKHGGIVYTAKAGARKVLNRIKR